MLNIPHQAKADATPQLAHHADIEADEDELKAKTSCIIIDPFSDFLGKHLKRAAKARGLVCVDVLSAYTAAALGSSAQKWRAPRPGKEVAWASKLPFKKVAFVLSESDVGTATAERMQEAIGAPGNGVNPIRRNKFLTNEALKRRGAGMLKNKMLIIIVVGRSDAIFESRSVVYPSLTHTHSKHQTTHGK